MRKRVAYIQFPQEQPGVVKRLEGLNVRFSVNIYTQSGMPASARIEIYNPSREDMEFLTTTVRTAIKKNYIFQLYGGYEDDVRLLFSGQVFEAVPGSYPDVVMTLRGHCNIKWWGDPFKIQKNNVKVIDLIDEAAKQMGYKVNVDDTLRATNKLLNMTRDEFSFTGSPMDLLEQAQSMMGGINSDPQTVFLSVYNEQINIWSPSVVSRQQILNINKNTGMIGLPRPTPTGCSVDILMNTGVKTGDVVRIDSVRMGRVINGEYYVVSIEHNGELRGNTWQTTLNCIAVNEFKVESNEE